MANIPGTVPIGGPIAPTSALDTYPSHLSEYGKGGWKSVETEAERDAVTPERREEGMIVHVRTPIPIDYTLVGGIENTDWIVKEGGGSSLWATQTGTYGEILVPVDPTKGLYIKEDSLGLTAVKIENANDVDNYTGAVIELKGSGAEYTNNVFLGKYGDNFWIPAWRGHAVLGTDKELIIAAIGTASKISFQVSGSYDNPRTALIIANDGTISSGILAYENLVLNDNDIPNKKYVDNALTLIDIAESEVFIINLTIITNGYVDLAHIPNISNEHVFVIINGLIMEDGEDYTLLGNRITFVYPIEEEDKVIIKYKY